jgi:hypothetical protein
VRREEIMTSISNRKFSLWLMPQEQQMTKLKVEQARILSQNPALPSFEPHITLIGGVEISTCCDVQEIQCQSNDSGGNNIDEEAAKNVLAKLQSAFDGFGSIECEFDEDQGVKAMIHADGTVKWNQASLAIVKQTKQYTKAMDTADKALFGSSSTKFERHYREPVLQPHYSFIYTDDATLALKLEKTLKCPSTFTSTTIAMWWTDPPTLEAVADKWKFVGNIYLDRSKL